MNFLIASQSLGLHITIFCSGFANPKSIHESKKEKTQRYVKNEKGNWL
jgi:hypothetical protein